MNKKNVLALADHIENEIPDELFDMSTYNHDDCGTAACIAGHECSRIGKLNVVLGGALGGCYSEARTSLGLSVYCATALFTPRPGEQAGRPLSLFNCLVGPGNVGYITRKHAIACLRHLAHTGSVDWAESERKVA